MKLRYKLLLILIVLGTMFGLGRCQRLTISGPKSSVPAVLPANDREQILVDPVHHSLIIVKPEGNQTVTLPDRQSVIDIRKDGSVVVTSKQLGFEHLPFVALTISDTARLGLGVDLAYWKRLDLGLGIACSTNYRPVLFAKVSYTVWDNVSAGLTYDSGRNVGGVLSLRI